MKVVITTSKEYADCFGFTEEVFEALKEYELALTNTEVNLMFRDMVRDWFAEDETDYNDFVQALLLDDVKAMNNYMNLVVLLQIEEKKYEENLVTKGIEAEKIRKYGFAFEGKKVLIG